MFNSSITTRKNAVRHTKLICFYLFFTQSDNLPNRMLSIHFGTANTNQGGLCWLVKNCLYSIVQVAIKSSSFSHICRVSPRGKETPCSWEPPLCISQAAWSCINHIHFILLLFCILPSPFVCFSDIILAVTAISGSKIILCPSIIGVTSVSNVQ